MARLSLACLRPFIKPASALLVLCLFLFVYRLADRDLTSSHEARAAQNVWSMVEDGAWGLPHLMNRRVELQKPPLYYWLSAILSWALGGEVNAWSVRLPAALSALVCVMFVFLLGRRCGRPLAGFLAALILATSVHFTWLARVGRIDMPLTLSITLAVGGAFLGRRAQREQKRGWPWFLLAYLAVAAGLLLKGPIAPVLSAAILLPRFILERRGRRESGEVDAGRRRSTLWWGIPLVLTLAGPWFIWANIQTDNKLFEVFFWYHNVQRGLGGANLASHPWWFYGPRLFLDLLPWSALFPFACFVFFNKKRRLVDDEAMFGFCWLLAVTVVLSLMRFKRADYLLPAYPGAALWLGCLLERWYHGQLTVGSRDAVLLRRAFITPRLASGILATVIACYVASWWVYVECVEPRQEDGFSYARLAREIRARTSLPVIFFRAEAHALAFHVGQPMDTILEWENLDVWATRSGPIYVVMPPDCARDWRRYLQHGELEEVLRSTDLSSNPQDRPLVLMRSVIPKPNR
jgi:4-amino-4-deoxy-L-arabinose transferase-like glycosyltransferase